MKFIVTHTDGTTEILEENTLAEAKAIANATAGTRGKSVDKVEEKVEKKR